MSSGIHSAQYQKAREAKRLEWKRRKRRCAICAQVIDYDAPMTDPEHFQLDHIKSRIDFPDLEFDPLNWQPTHASCNKGKGKGAGAPELGETSEEW